MFLYYTTMATTTAPLWMTDPQTFTGWDEMVQQDQIQRQISNYHGETFADHTSIVMKMTTDLGHDHNRIPEIIDVCPNSQFIEMLAMCCIFSKQINQDCRKRNKWTLRSSFYDLIEIGLKVTHPERQRVFINKLLSQWHQMSPRSTPNDLLAFVFDLEQIETLSQYIEQYRPVIEILYVYMPNEFKEFFMSSKGQHFWRALKRLGSVGFIRESLVTVLDHILVTQIGLPIIEFEPVDLGRVFTRCGWKPFTDADTRGVSQSDTQEVTDIIKVDELCYLTYPCQHNVTIQLKNGSTKTHLMNSREIRQLFERFGKTVPDHFARRQDPIMISPSKIERS